MTITLVFVLVLIALLAWVANLGTALAGEIREARARVRGIRDRVSELEEEVSRRRRRLDEIKAETAREGEALPEVRRVNTEARRRLTEVLSLNRTRLFVLSDRRERGDKEWIVVVQNPLISEIDQGNPVSAEWLRGRAHLVWAEDSQTAAERVVRRLSARPGYTVKSVEPNPHAPAETVDASPKLRGSRRLPR